MRLVTSARLRAIGVLLIEAAGLVMLVVDRLHGDHAVKGAVARFIAKARAL